MGRAKEKFEELVEMTSNYVYDRQPLEAEIYRDKVEAAIRQGQLPPTVRNIYELMYLLLNYYINGELTTARSTLQYDRKTILEWLDRHFEGESYLEIANAEGIHFSRVSHLVRKFEQGRLHFKTPTTQEVQDAVTKVMKGGTQ